MIQILLAFVAGILTIAAPCILLPLPIILGGSIGQNSKTRPLFITLGFVASFAGVALLLNILVQSLGLDPSALRTGAVAMLILFAIFMIWPTPFEKLMAHMSGLINRANKTGQSVGNGNLGGFVMGMIVGIIWAPCAGPILGSILTLIALEQNTAQASLLLIAYAVGAGIPMLGIAYGGQVLTTKVKSIAKYSARLQQIFGIVLIFLAGAIYFQYDTIFQAKIVEKFPGLGIGFEKSLINTFEDKDMLDKTDQSRSDQGNAELKDLGQAPEFSGIFKWLNSNPLTIEQLRGKVVLVDFWTYSCINCVRTLPYVSRWHDEYKDKGLVVIGVHTPEFAFEKDTSNVQTALKRHKITYPVAQDNDFATWDAYSNQYWPAKYLVDKNGTIVYSHFGEGKYEETENAIRQLLGLESMDYIESQQNTQARSPEMYFGLRRIKNMVQKPYAEPTNYSYPNRVDLNTFAVEGNWQFDDEKAILVSGSGKIKLHFSGKEVNMVAKSDKTQSITVKVGNQSARVIQIGSSDLYNIYSSDQASQQVLEISIPENGFEAFTFTFG